MCLLVIAIRQHERLPLIVAGNRDEFHARPTQAAHWWPDNPQVLGGRDLQAGGTWLAIHRNGRFATVTNYRDAKMERTGLKSRGHLVTDFLKSNLAPFDYLQSIDGDVYAGFNLLVVDPAVGRGMSEMFQTDMGNARRIDPAAWSQRPRWQRQAEAAARIFALGTITPRSTTS